MFLVGLKHRNTDPRNRNPSNLQFNNFFQFRFVCGIFFLNHLAAPSKGV